MSLSIVKTNAPAPRELGPPTPAERTIIARILIRHGYLPPRPPVAQEPSLPERPW